LDQEFQPLTVQHTESAHNYDGTIQSKRSFVVLPSHRAPHIRLDISEQKPVINSAVMEEPDSAPEIQMSFGFDFPAAEFNASRNLRK